MTMTAANLQRLRETAAELLAMPPGWDSYQARPIDVWAVQRALRFCAWLADDAPLPIMVPKNGGGVQLEWHTAELDEEMEFWPE